MKKFFICGGMLLSLLLIASLTTAHSAATEKITFQTIASHQQADQSLNPTLLTPANQVHLCDPVAVFSWQEASGTSSLATYTFTLNGSLQESDGSFPHQDNFNFTKKFTPGNIASDFRTWQQGDIVYLQLHSPLLAGKFSWSVTGENYLQETSTLNAHTYSFDYLPHQYCRWGRQCNDNKITAYLTPNPHQLSLTLTYPLSQQPSSLEYLKINEQVLASNVSLQSQQHSDYQIDQQQEQTIIQLPTSLAENNSSQSSLLQMRLHDYHDCTHDFNLPLLSTPSAKCTSKGLIPIIISPENNSVVSAPNEQDLLFIWDICAQENEITQVAFIFNGKQILTLPNQSIQTPDYRLRVHHLANGSCRNHTVRYELNFKRKHLHINGQNLNLNYNDPLNTSDWHDFAISVLDCSGTKTYSTSSRWRQLPGNLGNYFFCTNQAQCIQGTLADCLQAGKNCYFASEQACLQNATSDCDGNPPTLTYFWCNSEHTCAQGSLATCAQTGKNCYFKPPDELDDNHSCLEQAAHECSSETALYAWRDSSLACHTGSLLACQRSGECCYRLEKDQTTCPQEVKSCTTQNETVVKLKEKGYLLDIITFGSQWVKEQICTHPLTVFIILLLTLILTITLIIKLKNKKLYE